jgi:hypothetical protein
MEIKQIKKQVTGYEWLAIKMGSTVYFFSNRDWRSSVDLGNADRQKYIETNRRLAVIAMKEM